MNVFEVFKELNNEPTIKQMNEWEESREWLFEKIIKMKK